MQTSGVHDNKKKYMYLKIVLNLVFFKLFFSNNSKTNDDPREIV